MLDVSGSSMQITEVVLLLFFFFLYILNRSKNTHGKKFKWVQKVLKLLTNILFCHNTANLMSSKSLSSHINNLQTGVKLGVSLSENSSQASRTMLIFLYITAVVEEAMRSAPS